MNSNTEIQEAFKESLRLINRITKLIDNDVKFEVAKGMIEKSYQIMNTLLSDFPMRESQEKEK